MKEITLKQNKTTKNYRNNYWIAVFIAVIVASGFLFIGQKSFAMPVEQIIEENIVAPPVDPLNVTFEIACLSGGGIFGGGQKKCFGSGLVGKGQLWSWNSSLLALDPSTNQRATVEICFNNTPVHQTWTAGACWAAAYNRDDKNNLPPLNFSTVTRYITGMVIVNGDSFNPHWHDVKISGHSRQASITNMATSAESMNVGDTVRVTGTSISGISGYLWVIYPDGSEEEIGSFDPTKITDPYSIDLPFTLSSYHGSGTATLELSIYGPTASGASERIKFTKPIEITTGTIKVTSNLSTHWTLTKSGVKVYEDTTISKTYTGAAPGGYTIAVDNKSGYTYAISQGSSQNLVNGGAIAFDIIYTAQPSGCGNIDGNAATYISQSVPTSMIIGSTASVTVRMQNCGNKTWNQGQGHALGSQNSQDNLTWGMNRVNLDHAVSSETHIYTFTWTIIAPSTAGNYNFQWRMVQDGVEWFGDKTPNLIIAVIPVYNATLTINITGSGSVTDGTTSSTGPGTFSLLYPTGKVVNLTATPASNWDWVNYTGACSTVNPTCSVTMDVNKTVTATFNAADTPTINFIVTYLPASGTLNVSCNNPPIGGWNISSIGHRAGPSSSDSVGVGSYTITYDNVAGFTTPSSKTATVSVGNTTTVPQCQYSLIPLNAPTITKVDNVSTDNSLECDSLKVYWSYQPNGIEQSFTVWRSTDNNNFSQVSGTIEADGGSAYTYIDTGLTPEATYYYIVKAFSNLSGIPQTAASPSFGPILNSRCGSVLVIGTKISVNGSAFADNFSAQLKENDKVTFQEVLNNEGGNKDAVINYICETPSANFTNVRNLRVSGVGSVTGGIIAGSHCGIEFTTHGTKAPDHNNWIITFDTTFKSQTVNSMEVCSNHFAVNYTDVRGTFNATSDYGPKLCKKSSGSVPNFQEVAP